MSEPNQSVVNHRPESATAVVKLRVHPREKSCWVRAAQREKKTLSAWLTELANVSSQQKTE
jgi:hypothetical protein